MARTDDKTTVVANVFRDELVDESAGADGNVFRKAWPLEGPLTDEELKALGFPPRKERPRTVVFTTQAKPHFKDSALVGIISNNVSIYLAFLSYV